MVLALAVSENSTDFRSENADKATSIFCISIGVLCLGCVARGRYAGDDRLEVFIIGAETGEVRSGTRCHAHSADHTCCLRVSTFPKGGHTPHVGRLRVCAKEPLRLTRTRTIAVTVFMVLLGNEIGFMVRGVRCLRMRRTNVLKYKNSSYFTCMQLLPDRARPLKRGN
jgi:hypothetical protein